MLIDTHAHLNFNAFNDGREEVIKRTLSNDFWMINIGTNFLTSKKAVEIAQNYPKGVFAAIGLHPINLDTGLVRMKIDELEGTHFEKEFDYEKYKELALSRKGRLIGDPPERRVVAIGEIGLDYYWRPKTTKKKELFKEKQKELLLQQLNLAKELNLPVIFHCRMAHQDLIEVLKSQIPNPNDQSNPKSQIPNFKINGVMHGFVGILEQLKEYLRMGFYIGFNGIIFKKIEGIDFDEIIKKTPLEKILIETDCPYLTPPSRGNERNEPLYVKYIAQKIAKIKGESSERVAKITTESAKNLFKI